MVGIENFVVDGGLVRIMLAGTFANRPAFGTVGRIYVATDTGAFYYDTGSAWVSLGSSGATPNLQQVINAGGTVTD